MKGRILVVDDEVDICHNLADILADLGFEVSMAHNGASALELVRQRPFDLVLLDLRMPDMDGLTVYRKIKQLRRDTLAIVLTAYAASAANDEAVISGALRVIPKPLDFPELLGQIDKLLDRPLVLVVDDDHDLCTNLEDLLRERGFRVALAHDAEEAASTLGTRAYRVVLIDMKLPGGDGLSVFRQVRQANPEARTVVISGYRSEMQDLIGRALQEGADAVCYKPFDMPRLLETLHTLTGQETRRQDGELGALATGVSNPSSR